MASLPVKAVIMLVLILTSILLHPQASAETLFYYQGEDTGPDGLILSNYTVAQSRESGNTYVVSFTLTNSLRNPTVTLRSRGIFIAAVDPGGNFRSFEPSHQGVTMSPGTSLRLQGTLTPDEAGRWAIWPSYEILVQSPDSRQSIGKMGPEEWHASSFMVYSRERPDLTPVSLSVEPSSPWVGDEVRAKETVKNIGRSDSDRCDKAFND